MRRGRRATRSSPTSHPGWLRAARRLRSLADRPPDPRLDPRVKVGVDCGSSTARWPLPGGTMTDTAERSATSTDAVAAVRAWLEANWDPDLPLAERGERLGPAGRAAPRLPPNPYGRRPNRTATVPVQHTNP